MNWASTGSIGGQFIRFFLVGGAGFVVDSSVLYICAYGFGIGLLSARAVSFLFAASFTWYFNRLYTFGLQSRKQAHVQWAKFLLVNALGGGINYSSFALLVRNVPFFFDYPVVAVAIGSAAGLLWNFSLSRALVFR